MNTLIRKEGRKGFTLVEIMIVVVIIGLLAAMAIPGFNRVRANSVASAMDNDARQIASAAQQFFLEEGEVSADITYDENTGAITGDLVDYVRTIGRGYDPFPAALTTDANFTIGHALIPDREYTPEGVLITP